MAAIKLRIAVSELDNVLTLFNRIKVYRADDGVAGTYAEITDVETRVRLVQGTALYIYDDSAGSADSWYKTSYLHSDTALESGLSDPRQGEDFDVNSLILSVQDLKDVYLFGLDLTDDAGNPYPDVMFEWAINFAIDWLEKELDIRVRPTVIDERYDYYRRDYEQYMCLRLREAPIVSVEEISLQWPAGADILTFPSDWITIRAEEGQVNVVPTTGGFEQLVITAGGAFLPLLAQGRDFVPDMIRVQYTAGFPYGQLPMAIRELIGKKATFGPLNVAGDLLGGAGIASQSVSIDGLSQSFNTTCLAADSPVSVIGGDQPIQDVVRRAIDGEKMMTWCVNEMTGRLAATRVIGAVESGVKRLFEVDVSGASPVRMSKDHRCMTEMGWMRLHQAVNLKTLEPKVKFKTATGLQSVNVVKDVGEHPTYDIEVLGPWHNFVSGGLILHNSSATNAGYGARLLQYKGEIKEQLETLRRYYKGIRMAVV